MSPFDFIASSKEFHVDPRNIHTTWLWTHSGKCLRMCEFAKLFADWRTRAQIKSWKHENVDGFYTKTTQKGGFSKLCVKIKKKDVIPTYSIFQHVYRKHNLISFFRPNRILTVELHRSFFIYFVFQEKTLGDISFKLDTKIMNFMSVFFENDIIKSTQVLSIICNTICLQFFLYRAPLQSLGFFLLISSRISDFKCHSY